MRGRLSGGLQAKKCQGFSFPPLFLKLEKVPEKHRSDRDPVGRRPWNDVHSCHPAPPTCPGTSSCTCVARPRPELSFLGRSSWWGSGSAGWPSKEGGPGWCQPQVGPSGLQAAGETQGMSGAPGPESREGLQNVGCGESCTPSSKHVAASSPLWARSSYPLGVCLFNSPSAYLTVHLELGTRDHRCLEISSRASFKKTQ